MRKIWPYVLIAACTLFMGIWLSAQAQAQSEPCGPTELSGSLEDPIGPFAGTAIVQWWSSYQLGAGSNDNAEVEIWITDTEGNVRLGWNDSLFAGNQGIGSFMGRFAGANLILKAGEIANATFLTNGGGVVEGSWTFRYDLACEIPPPANLYDVVLNVRQTGTNTTHEFYNITTHGFRWQNATQSFGLAPAHANATNTLTFAFGWNANASVVTSDQQPLRPIACISAEFCFTWGAEITLEKGWDFATAGVAMNFTNVTALGSTNFAAFLTEGGSETINLAIDEWIPLLVWGAAAVFFFRHKFFMPALMAVIAFFASRTDPQIFGMVGGAMLVAIALLAHAIAERKFMVNRANR